MASAQVLTNSAPSRKLGHLEAGKKKLEEFRKRKAEGRIKKAGLTGQLQTIDGVGNEKYSPSEENEGDGTTTSTGIGLSAILNGAPSSPDKHVISTDENSQVSHLYEKSSYTSFVNGFHDHWNERSVLNDNDKSKFEASSSAAGLLASVDSGHTNVNNEENSDGLSCYAAPFDESKKFSAEVNNPDASNTPSLLTEVVSAERRLGLHSTLNSFSDSKNSSLGLEISNTGTSNNERLVDTQVRSKTISESINQRFNLGSASWHSLESSLINSSMPTKRSQEAPSSATVYGVTSGRFRSSFLDTLGVSRVSSTSHVSHPSNSFSDTTFQSTDVLFPSHEKPFANVNSMQPLLSLSPSVFINEKENSLVSSSDIPIMLERGREHAQAGHEILVPKKDEAFSALEQHIEDLTQEKFSLQRALDTSRTLADSLAAENTSITESYNHQAKVVSELKCEIERLQEEVKDQLKAVESLKLEYANAQLECNAADERAKILASEVIGLEDKALRLRSNELKLEKQSENLSSEIASYKRKVSVFEKERQDYQSTINAMQEEKKLLQSKLRKIYSSSKSDDTTRVSSSLRDASTSTDDLGDGTERQIREAEIISHNTMNELKNSTTFDNSVTTTLSQRDGTDALLLDSSIGIPCDQLRMINNISSLLSELVQEKEELIQALTLEISSTSKLKDLNKELSQKLEAQTQRLELLIAQRMATENILTKPSITYSNPDIMEYTDEGDEVVERVLGWILRFFPSGSSKRRTSKLL